MRWIRKRARELALAAALTVSLAELKLRPHGPLYAGVAMPPVMRVAQELALLQELAPPHFEHMEVEAAVEISPMVAALEPAPPPTAGGTALRPSLSVLIPTYNEELQIDQMLLSLDVLARAFDVDATIVDDASLDDTSTRLRHSMRSQHRASISVVQMQHHVGYFRSLQMAFDRVRHEHILILDAYAALGPEAVSTLLKALSNQGVVAAGIPELPGQRVRRALSARILDRVTRVLVLIGSGRSISNLYPPACMMRRAFLASILSKAVELDLHPYAYAVLAPGEHHVSEVRL